MNDLTLATTATLVIVYGRRRVGKTTIIERAYSDRNLLKLEGVEGGSKSKQLETALLMLSTKLRDPSIAKLRVSRWLEFFEFLSRHVANGKHTLYLEELQWLASYDDELISDFKIAWDNYLKKNPQLIVVLCGSSPSFMVTHVIKSKALYGRAQHQLHVMPFSLAEAAAYFGDGYAPSAVMDSYLTVGGIPEYLSHLRRSKSTYLDLCTAAFHRDGYFVDECDRVFVSSLAQNPHYRRVIDLLAEHRFLTRPEIAAKLEIAPGGTLSALLDELTACQFIQPYTSYDKAANSKLVRYEIADAYLQFYFRFIQPQGAHILSGSFANNPARALNLTAYQQWLGYSFGRWCRGNHHLLAQILGFSAVDYRVGPYFSRSTPQGFQIDLIFSRADRVLSICEIKYAKSPVGKQVIQEFERKLANFAIPARHTVQRVLISAEGADEVVAGAGYFDRIIDLANIFKANNGV